MTFLASLPGGSTKPDPVIAVADMLAAAKGTAFYADVYATCVVVYGSETVNCASIALADRAGS